LHPVIISIFITIIGIISIIITTIGIISIMSLSTLRTSLAALALVGGAFAAPAANLTTAATQGLQEINFYDNCEW
jgi:hypothetical protein